MDGVVSTVIECLEVGLECLEVVIECVEVIIWL